MGEIKTRNKTWRFTFNSNKGEHVFSYDPLEWAETEYGLDRDEDGMYFTFSGEYTYLKDSYDYLKAGLDAYGALWECTLTIEYLSTYTHAYVALLTDKLLDFASITSGSDTNGNTIKIPLKDSGFYSKLLTYEKDDIAYSNLETLAGDEITPYDDEYEEVTVYGQETITSGSGEFEIIQLKDEDLGFVDNIWPTIDLESNNDNAFNTVMRGNCYSDRFGSANFSYYADGVNAKVTIELQLSYFYLTPNTANPPTTFYIKKVKKRIDGTLSPDGYDIYETTIDTLFEQTVNVVTEGVSVYNNIDINQTFDIEDGYGLYFQFSRVEGDCLGGYMEIESNDVTNIAIAEKAPETQANLVSLFHVHDRLITAITGQADSFQSSVFEEDGKWNHIYAGNGYLFRGFPTIATVPAIEDEVTAQLSFNYKELKENMSKLLGVAYGMIEIEGKKIIICEDKDYFYQDEVVCIVKHTKKHSFTRSPDVSNLYYSSVNVGVPKKDYEQESGLIDYTTAANYTTILSIFENELDLECSYFTSGNWVEFARRLAKSDTETTDSKFDNDICLLETILDGGVRVQRTTEDFETITGIDKITTPINLNLTPARSLKRWGKWLKVGLQKYLTSYVKFGTSEILTTLSTLRTDESIEVFENKDILVNNLDDRLITGDIISVLCDVTPLDVANAQANPTGKWQLTDEETGETIQGWIKSLSTIPIGESLTNIELYEAAYISEIDNSIDWVSGESIDWVSGESIDWNNV